MPGMDCSMTHLHMHSGGYKIAIHKQCIQAKNLYQISIRAIHY